MRVTSEERMGDCPPKVSIGMPVFNGELYVREAIESILNQTYRDFELIISDNASTDATQAICEEYASRDLRIKYYRNSENLGGGRNQNRVAELSRGEYFSWAHYDDVRMPEFFEEAVKILDEDSSVVLCYSKTMVIDEKGRDLAVPEAALDVSSTDPVVRFSSLSWLHHRCEPIFGLIRSSVLWLTPLYGLYPDADRVLLAELSLYGRFHQIPKFLTLRRKHPLSTNAIYLGRQAGMAWWNPKKANKIVFPHFREFLEFLLAIRRSPLRRKDRIACYLNLFKWLKEYKKRLYSDIHIVTIDILRPPEVLRPIWRPALTWLQRLPSVLMRRNSH